MRRFEVDVLVAEPTTRVVFAPTPDDAIKLALAGKGEEKYPGLAYTYGEVIDVREVAA